MFLRYRFVLVVILGVLLQSLWSASDSYGQDVTINIQGRGSRALFIEEGADRVEAVRVIVGQTVRWRNVQTTSPHTATAYVESSNEIIFDTGELRSVGDSADVVFDTSVFEKAGGVPGGTVSIGYECDFHPNMQGEILLSDSETLLSGQTVRRDITTLSSDELTEYRDAWRAIQSNGEFNRLAGFHGCPLGLCHREQDGPIFLPWHREYLLRLEQALQAVNPDVALHYWDWTSDLAIQSGIPRAFTDRTYQSSGSTFRNPLRSFTFACNGPAQSTRRNPGPSFQLEFFADSVNDAYRDASYLSFNRSIDGPHGSLHVWVSGNMSGVFTAAYDPIFWAHHSNVDRQWASWQDAGGMDPPADVQALELPGFTGRVVGDVNDTRSLAYTYDQLDTIGSGGVGSGPTESFAMEGNTESQLTSKRKTFDVQLPASSATESMGSSAKIEVTVDGIPEHPNQSFMVHMFLNSPNVTLNDVNAGNPRYLGAFGIFGGKHREGTESAHQQRTVKRNVLTLNPDLVRRMSSTESGTQRNRITAIATDENGELVEFESVPIDSVEIERRGVSRPLRSVSNSPRPSPTESSREFEGKSPNDSFDEAYRNAAAKADAAFARTAKLEIEVIKIFGVRRTNSGLRELTVRIRATAR
ncbi:MAG: tyrosinase family protein [Planctomycetota bacterium]